MEAELDRTAIELVALDGHRMPLQNEERNEAIKLMVERNIPADMIAWRLCISVSTLRQHANRKKLKLTPIKEPAHWTSSYIDNRNKEHRQKRAATKRDERRRAKDS